LVYYELIVLGFNDELRKMAGQRENGYVLLQVKFLTRFAGLLLTYCH
jgi:hypothetical protein